MATVICVAVILSALTGCRAAEPREPFDRVHWSEADLTTRTRAHMVHDMLRQHPLTGLTEADVIALLGTPTPTDKWSSTEMVYVLGPTAGMPIDHEWLLIELDEERVVAGHAIRPD